MTKWSTAIIDELNKVYNNEITLSEFINKYWEEFKPVYIHVHKYIESDGDLYFLLHKFFSKIVRSDVQPVFESDNQLFNYFKLAVKNDKYDNDHKNKLDCLVFSDFETEDESSNSIERYMVSDENIEENLISEYNVQNIFKVIHDNLSEQYLQVAILLYKGYSMNEIRKLLGVSYFTVADRISVIRKVISNYFLEK